MADNPQCTAEDVDSFQTKLCRLLDHCGYTMDSEDEEPSLLIRFLCVCVCVCLCVCMLARSSVCVCVYCIV